MAEDLGISEKTVARAFRIAAHPISLDTPIDDSETSFIGDFIECTSEVSPEENAIDTLQMEIKKQLQTLSEREQRCWRCGLVLIMGIHIRLNRWETILI